MGPLVKPIEEVTMSQYIAARITSLFTPKYEAASFPLVRKRHLRMMYRDDIRIINHHKNTEKMPH